MNKHIRPSWMQHEIAPWSSAAKSMVRPGNTKCSMTQRYITSLADTKRYIQRKKERWGIQFCSWLRPREVHVLHAWRDYKLYSLGASRLASLGRSVAVAHFQNENVQRMIFATYQLILDFETKAECQVEYDVLKAKQLTQARTISLSWALDQCCSSRTNSGPHKGCQSSHST